MPALFDPRLLLGVATLSASAPALAGEGRIALHPVVVIGGGVPESAAASMTQAVLEELRATDVQADVFHDVAEPTTAAVSSDAAAPQKLAEGRKALQKLQLPKAIRALEQAVAGLRGDDAQLAEAALLLAEAHYRRGDAARGEKALEEVARAAPDKRLDTADYPPVFVRAFEEVRARVATTSRFSGGAGPLPGRSLRAGIAANVCDPVMRARAVTLSRASGAEVVVLLGIAQGAGLFTVGGFAGEVRTGRWTTLPTVKVDPGLLAAGIEAGKLARELAALLGGFEPSTLAGEVPFVDMGGVPAPIAGQPFDAEMATAEPARSSDVTAFTTLAPSSDEGLSASARDLSPPGIFGKWWFWTALGVGAAIIGGTTYYVLSRDRPGETLSVQAAW